MIWLSFRLAMVEGRNALEKGRFEKARAHFQRALSLVPGHPDTTQFLAEALWGLNEKDAARELLASCPGSQFLLAKFDLEEKRFENACRRLLLAAKETPKRTEIWHELGKTHLAAHRTEDALQAFHEAACLDPFLTPMQLSVLQEKKKAR